MQIFMLCTNSVLGYQQYRKFIHCLLLLCIFVFDCLHIAGPYQNFHRFGGMNACLTIHLFDFLDENPN